VMDPGNIVLGGGLNEERVGAGAVGTLEVIELDHGDARARRRLESRWVVDLRGGWRAKLGVCGGRGEPRDGNESQCEGYGQANTNAKSAQSEGNEMEHVGWTTPCKYCNGRVWRSRCQGSGIGRGGSQGSWDGERGVEDLVGGL
jgi:hypothetical protein